MRRPPIANAGAFAKNRQLRIFIKEFDLCYPAFQLFYSVIWFACFVITIDDSGFIRCCNDDKLWLPSDESSFDWDSNWVAVCESQQPTKFPGV